MQFYRYDMALTIKNIRANEIKKTNVTKNIDITAKLGLNIVNNNSLNFKTANVMTMRG